jgi:hypothetical protein
MGALNDKELLGEVMLGKGAGRPKKNTDNIRIRRLQRNEHGTSVKATMLRLRRDRPDLAERVTAGEIRQTP